MQWYQKEAGFASRLYTGFEYIRTYPPGAGHPFLISDSLQEGFVSYNGVLYPGVLLNYDIATDKVIIKGAPIFSIQLIASRVDSFSLGGRLFIRLAGKTAEAAANRFYEVLYNGKVKALAIRSKKLTIPNRPDEPGQFVTTNRYLLLIGERLLPVSDKKSLFSAFGPHKEAVKKHLQQQRHNYRNALGQALTAAAQYYDQINP